MNRLPIRDKLKRIGLFLIGALFAVPAYLYWQEVVDSHQWPSDFNGWLGLFIMPLMSIVAFLYAIFYRHAKRIDDDLEEKMNSRGEEFDFRLHNCLQRKGWHLLDRLIFKDAYDEDAEDE